MSSIDSDPKDLIDQGYLPIRMIPVDDLQVDHDYQRPEKEISKKIGKEGFRRDRCGSIRVAEREDGSLWIVDGQQRWVGAKMCGETEIQCEVEQSSGKAYEALQFVKLNKDRTPVKSGEHFQAKKAYHDPAALDIQDIFDSEGAALHLSKPRGYRWFVFACIAKIEQIYAENGPTLLRQTLKAFKILWNGKDEACCEEYLIATSELLRLYGTRIDLANLSQRLSRKKVSCAQLNEDADGEVYKAKLKKNGWNRGRALAAVLVEHYNYRRPESQQLPTPYVMDEQLRQSKKRGKVVGF